jgi:hypothetical protein
MTRANLENILIIAVLGLIGGLAVFQQVPTENAQLVGAICAGLIGYLAKGITTPAKSEPPQLPPVRPMPDLDIPNP